jgi:hypothetical protein
VKRFGNRWVAGLVAAVLACAGTVVAISPASASGCPEGVNWNGSQELSYAPGTFCIDADDHTTHIVFQSDQNLVWYAGNCPLWASNTSHSGATRLAFQKDGNIVVYKGRTALWAIGQSFHYAANTSFFWDAFYVSSSRQFVLQEYQWLWGAPTATTLHERRTGGQCF